MPLDSDYSLDFVLLILCYLNQFYSC